MPLNTFSPAPTSCSGVTLAPSVSVPSTTPPTLRLVTHMPSPLPSSLIQRAGRDERRFLAKPPEPEHERHATQEDQHAQADHLGGVAQRRRGGVLARVLHHLPHVPVLADPRARESHQPHEPRE